MTRLAVSGEGPPLLLLHGFTGSTATWLPFVERWEGFTCMAVDILGHGHSDRPQDPERYTMERTVDDLLALMDRLKLERTAVLGYSMGGRVALHLALKAQDRLTALILESASPGIENPAEREARVRGDNQLAEDILRDGIESFVDRWEALPLFASQARLPKATRESLRRQRLTNDSLGLANSLRGLGAGRQEPVLGQLGRLTTPTLLIAGELDKKYTELAGQMAERLPQSRLHIMPDAGHATHLEQPLAFVELVPSFIAAHGLEPAPTQSV